MSAGDLDDHLGPAGELARLRATHPDLDAYLKWALDFGAGDAIPIERAQAPFGAGISRGGSRVYIHPHPSRS